MDTNDNREKDAKHFRALAAKYHIRERYENVLTQIQDVLEALGIMDKVVIDLNLLGFAILNYFEDIDRLKEFQQIERSNVDKIYSYGTFWLLREKPIQIMDKDIDSKFLHINEKVFTMVMVSKMLAEAGIGDHMENPKLLSFMELIYYNFKYRTFTQRSLELMVSAFFCGCKFSLAQ